MLKRLLNTVNKTAMLTLLCLGGHQVVGQVTPSNHGHAGCGTAYEVAKSLAENPHLRANLDALEQLSSAYEQQKLSGIGNKSIRDSTLIIPVVVHIIHTNGLDNISKAQVDDAIRIMTEDLTRTANDTGSVSIRFKPIACNSKMIFRLATKDPNGNCTQGITRTFSILTNSAGENVKQLVGWPTERYYNIWVVGRIASGAGGYAYYPGTAPRPSQEGVVVTNSQFGSIGLSGRSNFSARTMTHETGHFFNLPHTWGSTNTPGLTSNCNVDDGVADTPNTVGVTGQGCPLTMMSCGNISNVENYMDYSNCGRMFSIGQGDRMRTAALSNIGSRSSLWQASNLIATGTADPYTSPICAPIGLFTPLIKQGCTNNNIINYGFAYNAPVDSTLTWKWISPTATPDTLFGRQVNFVYPTAGLKSVKLVLINSAGTDTVLVSNAVMIIDKTGGLIAPFAEDFEAPNFPTSISPQTSQWYYGSTSPVTWAQTSAAANVGNSSITIPLITQANNSTTQLFSPRINLSGLTRPSFFSFAHAFATAQDTANNRLIVSVSTDCGGAWQQIYIRTKSSSPRINTNTGGLATSTPFVPTAAEWRVNYVSLDRYLAAGDISIKIEIYNQQANAVYLDNINVGSNLVTDLAALEISTNTNFRIVPNPSGLKAQFVCQSDQAGQGTLSIFSLTGQLLYQDGYAISSGENTLTLAKPVSGLTSGTYIAKLLLPSGSIAQQKWVIMP